MDNAQKVASSFRDPSGFLFIRNGDLYRQVNRIYRENYDRLINSGLYESLVGDNLLIRHEEVDIDPLNPGNAYKTLRPEAVRFVSYPYEWSFSQLKDAALATLRIQKKALEFEMSLKDSSAFNIQFHQGRPILIDTLSFENYTPGKPWVAYRQFCQHFLAPLSLMAKRDIRLAQLLRVYIDGVPLDLASKLLPRSSYLNFALLSNIHLHAAAQKRYAGKSIDQQKSSNGMSRNALFGLVESLESGVKKLSWNPGGTDWGDYYEAHNYTADGLEHKRQLVSGYIEQIDPRMVWDLGGNVGMFSRLASEKGIFTISFDVDPGAVEQNYLQAKRNGEERLLPLVLDLTNPSASIGWHHQERASLLGRGPADAVLALALIHHLAISNNVSLPQLREFFHQTARWLIIEFVPKSDSQVQILLSTREDIFPDYNQEMFESVFGEQFEIRSSIPVKDSERILYLMAAK
ncbi:MAG TPA: hypothetical protein VFZ76_01050 [Anaerolineales bacterium]